MYFRHMGRSYLRIKYYSLMVLLIIVALSGGLWADLLSPDIQFFVFMIPSVVLMLLAISLKCDGCGRAVFDEIIEGQRLAILLPYRAIVLPKVCSRCGCERV